MLRSKKKYNLSFIFGVLFIIVGLVVILYNYFETKKIESFDSMSIALMESETPSNVDSDSDLPNDIDPTTGDDDINQSDTPVVDPPKPQPKPIDYTKYYVGTLEIPKINLKKGFLNVDSPYNNVDRNVTVIKSSDYPDVENGNFILAAHTGSSSISFFTKLHDLSLGDLAYINYKGKKYTYQLVNIYTQPKVGWINIYRDTSKNTLTLVTCTKNTQETQTIFILELINVE